MNHDELKRRLIEFEDLKDQLIARGQELLRFADRGGRKEIRLDILEKVTRAGEQLQGQATRIMEVRHPHNPELGDMAYLHVFISREEAKVTKTSFCSERNPTRGDDDNDTMLLLSSAKGKDFVDAKNNVLEMMLISVPGHLSSFRIPWLEKRYEGWISDYHKT